jgi:chromosomal replication initiation ATPase DnaA
MNDMILVHLLINICKVTGIPIDGVLKKNRLTEFVIARQLYCYYAKGMGFGLAEIGRIINRDHSTVHYSINKVNELQKVKDKKMMNYINLTSEFKI